MTRAEKIALIEKTENDFFGDTPHFACGGHAGDTYTSSGQSAEDFLDQIEAEDECDDADALRDEVSRQLNAEFFVA